MKYSFHAEAEKELNDARDYYNNCQNGLGSEFVEEVYAAIQNILSFPHAWAPLSKNTRRSLTNRFPYGVIYQITHDEIPEEYMELKGFSPVADMRAKILILGTFPGEESLRQKEYYAHPRNLFWDMMGSICGAGRDKDYNARLTILKKKRIALWDVLKSCSRQGSVDTGIRDGRFNDFNTFLSRYSVKAVFFNGKTAERLFQQHVVIPKSMPAPHLFVLPSTSPANARMAKDEKVRRWCEVKQYL